MNNDLEELSLTFMKSVGFSDDAAVKLSPNLVAWIKANQDTNHANLPDKPIRDYQAGEGIFNYLRSEEGFGAWLAVNALTRPIIKNTAPRAYIALANWLRSHNLKDIPEDIKIPTKSEVLDAELITPVSVRQARRIARRGDRGITLE